MSTWDLIPDFLSVGVRTSFCRGKVEELEAEHGKFLQHTYAVFKLQYFKISIGHSCLVKIQFLEYKTVLSGGWVIMENSKEIWLLESIVEPTTILRNVGSYLPVDTDLQPRRLEY